MSMEAEVQNMVQEEKEKKNEGKKNTKCRLKHELN